MGLLLGIAAILMAVTVRDGRNLVSLLGLVVFIFLTYIFSWKPSKVKWRPVVGALFFQFLFGWLVITTSWGLSAVQFLGDTLTTLLVRADGMWLWLSQPTSLLKTGIYDSWVRIRVWMACRRVALWAPLCHGRL